MADSTETANQDSDITSAQAELSIAWLEEKADSVADAGGDDDCEFFLAARVIRGLIRERDLSAETARRLAAELDEARAEMARLR